MKVEIVGTVARLREERTFASGTRVREVWIAEGGDEDRTLPVEFAAREGGADGIAQTLGLEQGMAVRAEAVLRGRLWQGRLFLSLRGGRIETIGSAGRQEPLPGMEAPAAAPQGPAPAVPPPPGSPGLDDLPF